MHRCAVNIHEYSSPKHKVKAYKKGTGLDDYADATC